MNAVFGSEDDSPFGSEDDSPFGSEDDSIQFPDSLLEDTRERFSLAMMRAEADYRKGLVRAIAHSDRIEVFLLTFDLSSAVPVSTSGIAPGAPFGPDGYGDDGSGNKRRFFVVRPYQKAVRVLDATNVYRTHRKWQELQAAIRSSIESTGEFADSLGHIPTHGIRIYSEDELLFETSVCFRFKTFFVVYGDGEYSTWHDLPDNKLSVVVNHIMPEPDRFRREVEQSLNSRRRRSVKQLDDTNPPAPTSPNE